MAVILDRIRKRIEQIRPGNNSAGPDLESDIQRENIETTTPVDRLNVRSGSIIGHVKKTWSDLKSLKNIF